MYMIYMDKYMMYNIIIQCTYVDTYMLYTFVFIHNKYNLENSML